MATREKKKKQVLNGSASVGVTVKLRNPTKHTAIVPIHAEIARGTLGSILRQAGLTIEEFRTLL